MKAILIDSENHLIREVEYEGDYRDIKRLLNIDSPVDARSIEGAGAGETLWFDDEGLLKVEDGEFHDYFVLNGVAAPIHGRGLILGANQDGESTSTSLSSVAVSANIEFKRLRIKGWTEPVSDDNYEHPVYGKMTRIIGSQPIFEEDK